jgi:hypothetical protein
MLLFVSSSSDIFLHEIPVKIRANGVVDESLLHLLRYILTTSLMSKYDVVVPSSLDSESRGRVDQQRIGMKRSTASRDSSSILLSLSHRRQTPEQ